MPPFSTTDYGLGITYVQIVAMKFYFSCTRRVADDETEIINDLYICAVGVEVYVKYMTCSNIRDALGKCRLVIKRLLLDV